MRAIPLFNLRTPKTECPSIGKYEFITFPFQNPSVFSNGFKIHIKIEEKSGFDCEASHRNKTEYLKFRNPEKSCHSSGNKKKQFKGRTEILEY
jgi:hypothetical protein